MEQEYVFDSIKLADPDPGSKVTTIVLSGYNQCTKKITEVRVSFSSAQVALDRIQSILPDLQKRLD